jgi:uncharacterized membrane protein
MQRLRRYLLTGIVVSAPVGVTILVLRWIFLKLDAILGRVFTQLGLEIPGLGLLALLVLLVALGWLASQAIGHEVIGLGKRFLTRFPLTRSIYGAASQIVEQLVGEGKKSFRTCVLIEYPRPGCWALGFLTGTAPREIDGAAGEESLAVFLPTTPNPTSGYLLFLPRSQVRLLKMSVEEGFKLVISGGAVNPDELLAIAAREHERSPRAVVG